MGVDGVHERRSPDLRPTIVIVEDDLPTLELYSRELSTEYDVLGTLNKQEALAMVQQTGVRAVIMEPDWGGGQGWELLEAIQRSLKHKTIPILLCSSLDERRRGLEMGAVIYLVKPVLPTELHDALHQILRK